MTDFKSIEEGLRELGDYIGGALPAEIWRVTVANGELTVDADDKHIVKVLTFLRGDTGCQFKQLIDLCGVDYPDRARRFDVVYHLLSIKLNHRVRVKIRSDEKTPVPSVTGVLTCAGGYVREAVHMYGIRIDGKTALRRALTAY